MIGISRTMLLRRHMRALGKDQDGVSLVEFALILPVFLVFSLGIFDYAHMSYAKAVMYGAVQDAARSAAMEKYSKSQAAVDDLMKRRVRLVNPGATVTATRTNYQDFSSVDKPELFKDSNNNGVCDNDESYEDFNGNKMWDSTTSGEAGVGGAKDVVAYDVDVAFPRLFPVWAFMNMSNIANLSVRTVVRNQPYSDQVQPPQGVCE